MAKQYITISVIEKKAEDRKECMSISRLIYDEVYEQAYEKNGDTCTEYEGKITITYKITESQHRFNKLWKKVIKLNPRISDVCVVR